MTQGGGSDVSYSKFEKKTSKCEMGEGVEKCYFVSDVHFEWCLTNTSLDKTGIILRFLKYLRSENSLQTNCEKSLTKKLTNLRC